LAQVLIPEKALYGAHYRLGVGKALPQLPRPEVKGDLEITYL
jgi:hypothetical protein